MNPITHLFASWTLGDVVTREPRDRHLITWAGVLPDLDGLGAAVDVGRSLLGLAPTWYFGEFHRSLLHGLPAAIALPALLALWARRKLVVFLAGVLSVHFHLFFDVIGSRGPTQADIWPVWYLAPFSDTPVILWLGQWPLNAWPNLIFTFALMVYILWVANRRGYSVVSVFHRKADVQVVAAIQHRWARIRAGLR